MRFLPFHHPRPTAAAAENTVPSAAPVENDAALVQECLTGSPTAWRVLVKKYSRLVMTISHRAGLADVDAYDVLQDTFEDLFKHLPGMRQPDRVKAWIVTAAKYNAIRTQKRIAKERHSSIEPHDWNGDLQRIEDQDELMRAIKTLPETQRIVLLAAFTENILPVAEIARMAGIQPGSVGKTRERGIRGLRKFFGG